MYERKPRALSAHGTSPPLIPIQALICGRLKKHGEAGIWLENQASELPLGVQAGRQTDKQAGRYR